MVRKAIFDSEKMFTYVRGFANGARLKNTEQALIFAREKHKNQKRKSGEPYITHPLTMACNAISLGIGEDEILATCLLHDVVEDCGVNSSELPVNEYIQKSVQLLTFTSDKEKDEKLKEHAKKLYYEDISKDRVATLVKLLDRCHNVSTMVGTFTKEKLIDYIEETRKYVLPLLQKAKELYPNDSDVLFTMKYTITSIIDSIEAAIAVYTR